LSYGKGKTTDVLKKYDKNELIKIIDSLVKGLSPDQIEVMDEYLYNILVMHDPNINIQAETGDNFDY